MNITNGLCSTAARRADTEGEPDWLARIPKHTVNRQYLATRDRLTRRRALANGPEHVGMGTRAQKFSRPGGTKSRPEDEGLSRVMGLLLRRRALEDGF